MAAPALSHLALRRLGASASASITEIVQHVRQTFVRDPDFRGEGSIVNISDIKKHNLRGIARRGRQGLQVNI
jgi:hypothetical protein